MENNSLYMSLKNKIMMEILNGTYRIGEAIPSERDLSRTNNMSRAAVHKALEIFEREGILQRTLGKGTIVSMNQQGRGGNLNTIALVAPAQRRFFANFINSFQKVADIHNSLVVFIQQSEDEFIQDTLFKLLQNNIHNVVIWLDFETISKEYVQRLRCLGMNIVFFDITVFSPYADCICLDNQDAITSLYNYALEKGSKKIAYITRQNTTPSSFYEREQAFLSLSPFGIVWEFPWDYQNFLANHTEKFIFEYFMPKYKPDTVICSDGEVGIILKKAMIQNDINDILLISVDDFDEAEELEITVYKQPYDLYAEAIYNSLMEQNSTSTNWTASISRVKGELIIRD